MPLFTKIPSKIGCILVVLSFIPRGPYSPVQKIAENTVTFDDQALAPAQPLFGDRISSAGTIIATQLTACLVEPQQHPRDPARDAERAVWQALINHFCRRTLRPQNFKQFWTMGQGTSI